MRRRLDQARAEGIDRLQRMGFELFAPPDNGLYGMVMLPEGLDDMAVSSEAAQQGILLAPGSLFRADPGAHRPSMRVNWSRVQDSRFYSFLRSLV
jgi:DNA-binding transcriptional MocR family regulator